MGLLGGLSRSSCMIMHYRAWSSTFVHFGGAKCLSRLTHSFTHVLQLICGHTKIHFDENALISGDSTSSGEFDLELGDAIMHQFTQEWKLQLGCTGFEQTFYIFLDDKWHKKYCCTFECNVISNWDICNQVNLYTAENISFHYHHMRQPKMAHTTVAKMTWFNSSPSSPTPYTACSEAVVKQRSRFYNLNLCNVLLT